MKVALVSIRFDTKGGSERRAWHLASGLIRAGHSVEIFAAEFEDSGIKADFSQVPMRSGPSFVRVSSFTANVNRMLAARTDFDVVHNQIRPFTDGVVTVGGGCHAEYLRKSGGSLGFLNPLHPVVLRMERERYREGGCRAVITNSEYARAGILRHYPIPPEKVYVAYNGVDLDKFSPASASRSRERIRRQYGFGPEPVILFMGSGFKRKGLMAVIKAVALLKDREDKNGGPKRTGPGAGFRLLVAGKDKPGGYRRMAEWLKIGGRVSFAGAVSDPESYYGAADIFVLPTRYDPFANAALEAMACGLPIVTSRENGVAEVITDGESGFLMEHPDDHAGLADILARLSDEGLRKKAGGAARRVAEGFTWEKTLEKTLDVYRLSA